MFTGAKGPWKTNFLLQSLPGSSQDKGSSRIQALLKMSGKVEPKSSDFWSHHVLPTLLMWLMLPCFAQCYCYNFVFVFTRIPSETGDLGCESSGGLPISHGGCVVPWPLSVDTAGRIVMVYLCCITASHLCFGDCSGASKFSKPQWFDGNSLLVNVRFNYSCYGCGVCSTQVQVSEQKGTFLQRINH